MRLPVSGVNLKRPALPDVAVALRRMTSQYSEIATAYATANTTTSDEEGLLEGERGNLEEFTALRRAQYAAGRRAARDAIARLGGPRMAIPSTARGVPCFPSGFVGSISHKRKCAIAAVADAGVIAAVGLDLEDLRETREEDLLARVCTEREQETVGSLHAAGVASPATWLHSTKEAVFKAMYALDAMERDYEDIEVALIDSSRFAVRRLAHAGTRSVVGYFAIQGNSLISLAILASQRAV